MLKEKAALTLVCDDCPEGKRAEVDVDRLTREITKKTPDNRVFVEPHQKLLLPPGWELADLEPPRVKTPRPDQIAVWTATSAEIAQATDVAQRVTRCPSCAEKARAKAVVESAGLVVVPGGGA